MASGFNLTAQLNLQGPTNVASIVKNIKQQIGNINANVNVNVSNNTTGNITKLTSSLTNLNSILNNTSTNANSAAQAIRALGQAIGQANNPLNNLQQNLQNNATAAGQLATSLTALRRNTQQCTNQFEEFGRQSAIAVRRFAAMATVTSIIYKFGNSLDAASKEFVEFNKELVRVAQVTDTSLSGLDGLVREITGLSVNLGVASNDLIKVSSTLAQAGLSARDTEKALKALALSALAPSFDSLNDTVEGSIALMRQFNIGAGDLEGALGSVNAVAAKFAVEAGDIITAIQRTGGVFATASKGVSEGKDALNEFIAVFTSIRATTRESAETISTGLRTIFTRLQRKDTIDALKQFGVVLTDLEGKFVGPYEASRRLSEGLSKLDPRDLKFSQIVEELGGFRQIGKVIPLIQQFATAQEALKVAQQGQGSLAKDAAIAQESVANKMTKVREEFIALVRSIGESQGFQTFIKLTLDLTSSLIKLADAAKGIMPALLAIGTIRGAGAAVSFGRGFVGGLRRHEGGSIPRFASGGFVPGQGNGDTVPAMLTPGEFVIRKKAVQAIGADKLAGMNKYAGGGIVDDLDKGVGAAILEYKQGSESEQFKVKINGANKTVKGTKQGLNEKTYSSFDNALNEGIRRGVNYATRIVSKDLGISSKQVDKGEEQKRFLAGINDGTRGNLFEDILRTMRKDSDAFSLTDKAQRPFDFPNGLSGTLKDNYDKLPAKWIDAKASFDAARNSLQPKTQRQIDIELGATPIRQKGMELNIQKQYKLEELKKSLGAKNAEELALKGWRKTGSTAYSYQPSSENNLGGPIQEFAKGGSPKDTVPALLTPGEFVINKKAASRIGLSTLHKMNHADKVQGFNKGGGVQKFAQGGNPWTGGTGQMASPQNINPWITSGISAQAQQTAQALQNVGQAANNTAASFKGMGPATTGLRGLFAQLGMTGIAKKLPKGPTNPLTSLGLMMGGGAAISSASSALGGDSTDAGRKVNYMGTNALNYSAVGGSIGTMVAPILGPLAPLGPLLGTLGGAVAGLTIGFFEAEKAAKAFKLEANKKDLETQGERLTKNTAAYVTDRTEENRQNAMMQRDVVAGLALTVAPKKFDASGSQADIQKNISSFAQEYSSQFSKPLQETKNIIVADMKATNKTFAELATSMDPEEFKQLNMLVARSSKEYIQMVAAQDSYIENLRYAGNDKGADEAQAAFEKKRQEFLAAEAANLFAAEDATIKTAKAAEEARQAAILLKKSILSIETSFDVVSQSLNKSSFDLANISNKAEEIMSGKTTVRASAAEQNIDILKNPSAYSKEDRAKAVSSGSKLLGDMGPVAERLVNFGDSLDSLTSTTIKNAQKQGKDTDVGDSIRRTLTASIIANFGEGNISSGLIDTLNNSISGAIDEAAKNGQAVDWNTVLEKITGPLKGVSDKASKAIQESLKLVSDNFAALSKITASIVEIEYKKFDRENDLLSMQASSRLSEKEALGINVGYKEKINARMASVSRNAMLGGAPATPQNLSAKIKDMQNQRDNAANQVTNALDNKDFAMAGSGRLNQNVQAFNTAIAKTKEELLKLPQTLEASISDIFNEMQKRVGLLEATKAAGQGLAEKMVTSTPKELMDMNRSFVVMNNAIRGNVSNIQQSRDAQQAYFQALNDGKSVQEAVMEAQQAYAMENRNALQLFDELTKVAGVSNKDTDNMKADMLQSMANAQGTGNNQVIKNIIAQLRKGPEGRADDDPVLKHLRAEAKTLRAMQQQAVTEAAKLDDESKRLLENTANELIIGINAATAALNESLARAATERGLEKPQVPNQVKPVNGQFGEGWAAGIVAQGRREAEAAKQKKDLQNRTQAPNAQNLGIEIESADTQRQEEEARKEAARRAAQAGRHNKGGVVYASGGKLINFKPKGTDTVPAMLTPGEFVVNSKSASKNMGLLHSINRSKGGDVNYLKDGGFAGSDERISRPKPAKFTDKSGKFSVMASLEEPVDHSLSWVALRRADNNQIVKVDWKKLSYESRALAVEQSKALSAYTLQNSRDIAKRSTGVTNLMDNKDTSKRDSMLKNGGEFMGEGRSFDMVETNAAGGRRETNPRFFQSRGNTGKRYGTAEERGGMFASIDAVDWDAETITAQRYNNLGEKTKSGTYKWNKFAPESLKQALTDYGFAHINDVPGELFFPKKAMSGNFPDITQGRGYEEKYPELYSKTVTAKMGKGKSDETKTSLVRLFYYWIKRNQLAGNLMRDDHEEDSWEQSQREAADIELSGLNARFISRWGGQANSNPKTLHEKWERMGDQRKLSQRKLDIARNISRANGGLVYASKGQLINFQPKGTDTVPAMLTPGEFVVNAKSTAKHLPLLKSINRAGGGSIPRIGKFEVGKGSKKGGSDIDVRGRSGPMSYLNNGGMPFGGGVKTDVAGNQQLQNTFFGNKNIHEMSSLDFARMGYNIMQEAYIRNMNGDSVSMVSIGQRRMKELQQMRDDRANQFKNQRTQRGEAYNNRITAMKNANYAMRSKRDETVGIAGSSRGAIRMEGWSNGGMIPRGTDTVPAMLSKGEYVVNRKSAQKNIGLLENINRGYSNGGVIYRQNGGPVGPVAGSQSMDGLAATLNNFVQQMKEVLPSSVGVEGKHDVNVIINGAAILQNVLAGPLGELVKKSIEESFMRKNRQNEGS